MQLVGYGSGKAIADRAVIDFTDGRELCRGAGEEHLVGDVEELARNTALLDSHSQIAYQGNGGVAGDARQDGKTRLGRVDQSFWLC